MATFSLGTVPSPIAQQARLQALRGPQINPLDALIQGFQQGQALEQLPQQQAQQALAAQLQNALLQQKLQDLQNPQAAMERDLLKRFQEQLITSSFDPASGIRRAGVGAPPVGEIEPVVNPITNEETGFVRDLEMRRSALARDLRPSPSQFVGLTTGADGTSQGIVFRPTTGTVENIPLPTGVTDIRPKVTQPTRGVGSKGITANAQQTMLGNAAFENINLEDPRWKDELGNWKITEINIETNKRERLRKDDERQAKLAGSSGNLSSKQEDELAAIYLTQDQLGKFKDVISNIEKTSGEPGAVQNALAVVASNPSDGIWSSLARQGAEFFMTDDSRIKEDVRGTVSSAIQSAISGKVITRLEATQLGFIPKADDTIKRLIQKGEGLENYLKNKEAGILKASGQPVTSPVATPGINSNAPSPIKSPSGNTFRIIR